MLYDDQIATLYRVENGFVVECREKKAPAKTDPKADPCCCTGPGYETKTYTAKNDKEVMQIISQQLGNSDSEYSAAFKEASAKAKK